MSVYLDTMETNMFIQMFPISKQAQRDLISSCLSNMDYYDVEEKIHYKQTIVQQT